MIKNYLKIAIRNLGKNKGSSFINIAGLSIGLACAMLIILYVKDEVSYDRFHKNGDRIFRIVRKITNPDGSVAGMDGYTGYSHGPGFSTNIPEIKTFIRFNHHFTYLKTGKTDNEVAYQEIHTTDPGFFSVFSFPLLYGDPKTALSQPNNVVISENIAKQQFGTTNAIGKTMLLMNDNKFKPYLVSGVARECPQNSSIKFQILLPISISKEEQRSDVKWFNFSLHTFVVLAPNADPKIIAAKMQRVYQADARESIRIAREKYDVKSNSTYSLQPLNDLHLSKDYPVFDGLTDASSPMFSYILSGIALFILLIACINFVNLTVARSIKRAKEIGIRKAIGSSRKQLITQFMGETLIVCLVAFIMAIALVEVSLPFFNQIANKALALSYLLDLKLTLGYISLFLITTFLAGFYPSLVLSGYNPVQTLYSKASVGGKNYLHKLLVVLQFSLASFLIISTLVVSSQFNFLTTEKLGYDDSDLLSIYQWGITPQQMDLFKQKLAANPNIVGVTAKDMGYENETAKLDNGTKMGFVRETVDQNFLPLMKIPVANGRNFSKDFLSDSSHSILVNETFAKQAGWKNAVGQPVEIVQGNEKYNVVGVVKDYHFEPLNSVIRPQIFTLKGGRVLGNIFIKIRPKTEVASLQQVEKAFKFIFPMIPMSYSFKNDENVSNYRAEANWKRIMLFGAVITIFISCIGLFGLSVLSAETRTKEIGIRKVLGASVSVIVAILSKDFLKLVIIALLIAIPFAWMVANKWLQTYPYRISLSWWIFGSAGLVVIIVAAATVSFQTIKAALANPIRSLRSE